jgi:putative Holliday junction resolvase
MIIYDKELFHKIVPSQGKLMSIDVGTKRIGIASCDELRFIATPKKIINRTNINSDFLLIKEFAFSNLIKAVVIGFPLHMDGKLNNMSEYCNRFAQDLDIYLKKNNCELCIIFADERLSSFEAQDVARDIPKRKKQKHHDDIAAAFILQRFIDDL